MIGPRPPLEDDHVIGVDDVKIANPAFREVRGRQSSWLRLEKAQRSSPRSLGGTSLARLSVGAVDFVRTSMA
jgi:hypothetical protein